MRKNRRIVIICGSLESGGAERVISVLSSYLAEAYDEVTIIPWRDKPVFYTFDERVRIIPLPSISYKDNHLYKMYALRKWIKKYKPDLVLSFLTPFNILTLLSLLGIKVKKVVAERNDPRFTPGGTFVINLMKCLYRTSDGILCQTLSIKNFFKGRLHTKAHIIYNPVFLSTNLIARALSITKKNRIVSVGRLHHQKNHKLLIDAFSIFHKTHPSYTLSIYGKGELKEEIQKYIEAKGLDKFVFLEGEHKNVVNEIMDAKAFVMTSTFEGMPNALIEAMCIGLPCISTYVSGAVDLIENGKNGVLVTSGAIEIGKELVKLVDNPEYAYKLGNRASLLYDILMVEIIAREWVAYLNSILQKK